MQTLRDLEELRHNLTEKLEELQRRASSAAELAGTAVRYWQNPAVRFGLGVFLGLALGGSRKRDADRESLVHAILRAGLMAATTSLVSRTLSPGDADDGNVIDAVATPAITPGAGK